MAKNNIGKAVLIIAIAAVALLLVWNWGIKPTISGEEPIGEEGAGFQDTCTIDDSWTLKLSVLDQYNKSTSARPDVNGELWDGEFGSDATTVQGETQINSAATQLSATVPQKLGKFFVMIGNDNYVSDTDRGLDYYYRKFDYEVNECMSTKIFDDLTVYQEGTPTWTFYEDGTSETTANITVGSGETYTDGELKFKAGTDACIGNPEFNGGDVVAVCFNGSVENDWDSVKPESPYIKGDENGFSAPQFLSGTNVIGDVCYVLDTDAVCDSNSYKFGVRLEAEAATNPGGGGETVSAILIDKSYYLNDLGKWEVGWEDASNTVSDSDIGIDGVSNAKPMHVL